MPTHQFSAVTRLPLPLAKVFPFFADIANLDRITPPELGFKTLTPSPVEMRAGALIDHEIRLFGLPMKWRTHIAAWTPPFEFVDEQVLGPYAEWVHRHSFEDDGQAGTVMRDQVTYRLPLSPFGEVAYPFVRLQIRRIFAYREKVIRRLLDETAPSSPPG
jgi:ligand-binding SRPBCC domain-containing protein